MADIGSECSIPQPIQSIGCQDLLEMTCTHCGWLRKQRTLKLFSWPHTYVVLHDGCLYYFRNERAKTAAGKFSLYGYNSVYRASDVPSKEERWSFKIVHSHTEFKTYYFSASSEQEMKIWMSKIKQEMLQANGKSAIYGKNLHYVREEKPDKLLEDPSFYQHVEENIYDDSSKFVPSQDYQKQYSIKRTNEDSDSEDEEVDAVNPSINDRPPIPLPHNEGPFVTLKPPQPLVGDLPAIPIPVKVPMKPPRQIEKPLTPPSTHRRGTAGASGSPNPIVYSHPHKDKDPTPGVAQKVKQFDNISSPEPQIKSPHIKRKGSYEKTEGPGNKSPLTSRRGQFNPVPVTSGGGSTGDEDASSDMEEDVSAFYFEDQDKVRANEIILDIGEEGVYLVRPENNGTGKVLVVGVAGGTKKYRIQEKNDEYFLAKEGYHHRSIEGLLRYYYHNCLPTVELKLKTPYKNHPKYRPS